MACLSASMLGTIFSLAAAAPPSETRHVLDNAMPERASHDHAGLPGSTTVHAAEALTGLKCPGGAGEIPLLVVNLPDRTERLRDFMSNAPEELRPKICRIRGVMGTNLPEKLPASLIEEEMWARAVERTKTNTSTIGLFMTMGGVGLYFSHARAWKHMVENNVPLAMIAEDDLAFYAPSFNSELERACSALVGPGVGAGTSAVRWSDDIATLPDKAKRKLEQYGYSAEHKRPLLIQLQSCQTGWDKPGRGNTPKDVTREKMIEMHPDKTTTLKHGTKPCMGLYLLTLEGAKMALQAAWPIKLQLDTPGCAPFPRPASLVPPITQCDERRADATDVQIVPETNPFKKDTPLHNSEVVQKTTEWALNSGDVQVRECDYAALDDESYVQKLAEHVESVTPIQLTDLECHADDPSRHQQPSESHTKRRRETTQS